MDSSKIHEAIFDSNSEKLEQLFIDGLDENWVSQSDKWNLLHKALKSLSRHAPIKNIEYLVSKGVDVNARDTEGWTPLHFAARSGHIDAVRLLVEKSEDLEVQHSRGGTALAEAFTCYPINLETIKLLLDKGANPDHEVDGDSPRLQAKRISSMENSENPTIYDLFT